MFTVLKQILYEQDPHLYLCSCLGLFNIFGRLKQHRDFLLTFSRDMNAMLPWKNISIPHISLSVGE